MVRSRLPLPIGTLAALLAASAPAAAQVPAVNQVFPPGGQSGTTSIVTIGGGNLQGATQILGAGEGVTYKITKNTDAGALPVEISIAKDALPGPRELRVVTPRGTSNAGRIWVGAYPEALEKEPNNPLSAMQKLEKLPLTVNGQVNGAEDMDVYTFEANAGDTYVFDLVAMRMVSPLDGYLSLTDTRGKSLAFAQEAFDRDPRIIHTFSKAGSYAIQVRDTLFRNGPAFVYKLTVGKVPVVTGFQPRGGKRGGYATVLLEGVNLGDAAWVQVPMPASGDMVAYLPTTPSGPALAPIVLAPSDLDVSAEEEPNDKPEQATAVAAVPAVIDGRIERRGDVDTFRIKPAADGNLAFDLQGRLLGSRIDSLLRILDPAGKQLQENDDAEGKDSRIASFAVKANTEYLVQVRALDQSHGPEAFYRLAITPPAGQDFRLTVQPDELNVGQGGSVAVTVNAARQGGFGGPIALRVEGLPPGVTASPAAIPAGQNTAQFTLTAAPNANPGALGLIRVVGTGTIANAPVERLAQPVEVYTPPLAQPNQTMQRPVELFPATVMPQQAYILEAEPRQITVKKGQTVEVKVKATRQMAATQAIAITAAGQPANVTIANVTIPEKQNEVVLKIVVAANAPTVTQNVILSGNLANNVQVAPALTLTITD